MTLQHWLWHIAFQVSMVYCVISHPGIHAVVFYPDPGPVVLVGLQNNLKADTLSIQHHGSESDLLLTCSAGFKKCTVRKGHTLEEAMKQLADTVADNAKGNFHVVPE